MKAAYIEQTGPPENIKVGDLPRPEPGPGQVLVKVRAVALNPIDLYIRSGLVAFPLAFPYVIGCDVAGTVEEVGPGCKRFKAGDRVWGSNQGLLGRQGVASEFAAVGEEWLYPTPTLLPDDQAAGMALVGHHGPPGALPVRQAQGRRDGLCSRRRGRSRLHGRPDGQGGRGEGRNLGRQSGSHGAVQELRSRPGSQLQDRRSSRPASRVRSRGLRRLVRNPARAQPRGEHPALAQARTDDPDGGTDGQACAAAGGLLSPELRHLRLRHVQRDARGARALRPRHHSLGRRGNPQADRRPYFPSGRGRRCGEVPRSQHRWEARGRSPARWSSHWTDLPLAYPMRFHDPRFEARH